MPSLSQVQLNTLHSQHTLASADLLKICQLAQVEGLAESLESWSFEQFFGFSLHLFITTESAATRAAVAQLLPKFGSGIVLPLVKISHHFQAKGEISRLAQQSLGAIAPRTLLLGIKEVLETPNADSLKPILVKVLANLSNQSAATVLILFPEILQDEAGQALKQAFLTERNHIIAQTSIRVRLQKSLHKDCNVSKRESVINKASALQKETPLLA